MTFRLARDQVVRLETAAICVPASEANYVFVVCSIFELGGLTQIFIKSPMGNSEFRSPRPWASQRNKTHCFIKVPVIKCLVTNTASRENKGVSGKSLSDKLTNRETEQELKVAIMRICSLVFFSSENRTFCQIPTGNGIHLTPPP